ncbi:MAG: ATP-binding protein, partial [Oceanobacter sp.]
VSDMLWLAKADNGQQVMKLTQCALEDEMTDLLEFFEALADEKAVGLTLTGTAPDIMADRNMLRRAINNLLSNALRHAPEHSQIEVTLSEKKTGEDKQRFACLQISNTGAPIPAEHLPHLFERFYRADPSRHRSVDNPTDNSGLGLAITRSIVQLHQGKIRVESDQTSTRFFVTLPLEFEPS